MTAPLVFIMPVRHHDSVKRWDLLQEMMAQTIASIAAQTASEWECIVVANRGCNLPVLPSGFSIRYVDLPLPVLPDRTTAQEAFRDVFRADKGQRVWAGLREVDARSYVMIVDFDDFVSRRLCETVLQQGQDHESPGWNVNEGYIWAGGRWCFAKSGFHMICGTSHIIRRDAYGSFTDGQGQPDMTRIKRRLGSHVSIHDDLTAEGLQLSALPYPGAVYRIGNSQSTSGTGALFRTNTPLVPLLRRPRSLLRNLARYRKIGPALQKEFTLPVPGGA